MVMDLWRRSNDALYESRRCTVDVSYPDIGTKVDVEIPAGNILDAFKAAAKSVNGDASFDGFCISLGVASEHTEVARFLKGVRIDDMSIPDGTRFWEGMETLRRRINMHCASGKTDSVEFEYLGAVTNEAISGVRLSGVSAFEAISNICARTHREFFCLSERSVLQIGLTEPEYERRFRHLHFPGGRYSGESFSDAARKFWTDLRTNLERNDLLPVGMMIRGSGEKPICVEVEPGETWTAIESFARKTGYSVEYKDGLLRLKAKEDEGEKE